jgi:hypothetical protein
MTFSPPCFSAAWRDHFERVVVLPVPGGPKRVVLLTLHPLDLHHHTEAWERQHI